MIKIVRLKTGEDVICFFEQNKKSSLLMYPVETNIKYNVKKSSQELYMNFWLPRSLVEDTEVTIENSQILLILEPRKEFKEYYLNFLNNFKKIEELTAEEGLEELNELVEELENFEMEVKTLH